MLIGIYERVKANEFKTGSDHVAQVLKVQSTIVGKKPVSMITNFVWLSKTVKCFIGICNSR